MTPLATLLPKFATERELNVGRGQDGFLGARRGARVPVRTRYAEGAEAWAFEVAADDGRLVWCATGRPVDTRGRYPGLFLWDRARPIDRMIYALDAMGQLYVADPNEQSPDAAAWRRRVAGAPLPSAVRLWHHASLVGGRPVICAGDLETDADGRLRAISNWSGHYQPTRAHLAAAIARLGDDGVDVSGAVAEVVAGDGRVRVFEAAPGDGAPEVTETTFRARAIALVCRFFSTGFDEEDAAELDARAARLREDGSFDPGKQAHWSWLARYVVEDRPDRLAPR